MFKLHPSQTWTVWSRETQVGTFVESFASQVVTNIVKKLCDGMLAVVLEAEATIEKDYLDFDSALKALFAMLREYQNEHDSGVPQYVQKLIILRFRRLSDISFPINVISGSADCETGAERVVVRSPRLPSYC